MQLTSPIDAVARAIHHAAFVAIPDIHYRKRELSAMKGWSAEQRMDAMRNNTVPETDAVRRPDATECEVFAMFAQTWGSTALGFGGIGGAAMTPAYTVIVAGPNGHLAVYWAGRFAYLIDPAKQTEKQRKALQEDLGNRWTVGIFEAASRYGTVLSHGDV
ncbi:hypothetical protein WJ96_06110 [Burkholderia ubonensis]|uniref:Uncharacterized protein n=1 Tax=Burkholderia ubonensis TaxID=101571 RepID=A0AAW3MW29_9BURK|nr:hypothetical protein [Burkholderia ubonensis]KVP75332.1 hypothetical protein WJ93_07915 [Burkholderia ubonensis]KVP96800.1 hypothetical protein WJ97_13045 [Burkholderia ubonensis]KVP98143.1 hypothetical protein WJ96_06110 [Burkholderia ubonensis]KVZ92841.1 hypothetical protein WL25_17775 [Burkholderia ubonensis]